MRNLLSFILMKLRDQRGEVGEDEDSSEEEVLEVEDIEDDVINIDPDDLEEEEEEEEVVEKKAEDNAEITKELESLKAEIAKRDEQIKESNRNFYGLRKKLKGLEVKSDDTEEQFTDAQLKDMLEEHRDDPQVMLQIMKQVSKQASKTDAEAYTQAAEVSQRKKELETHLVSTWPDVHNEGSQTHQDIEHAKEFLHVTDHPLGDFIGGAGMVYLQLDQMLEDARKEEREKILKDTTEVKRKKSIKENSLETGKKKGDSKGLSSKYRSTAKQLNLTKSQAAIYAKLLGNDKQSATVEA